MKNIRVIFMGTPDFAVPILEALIKEYNVVMVVSQPDREKDRKGNIIMTPCKKLAMDNNISVYQPLKIRENYQEVLDMNPDIVITCAYGQIIPNAILDYPKYGCINVHGSLLPKLRGGAPIHHAIIDGYSKTGITIMYMNDKMDGGDIISQKETIISEDDILDTLYSRMSLMGRDLLIETLPDILNSTNKRIKQNELEVTFGFNIKKEEEKLNFSDTAKNIRNRVRGLNSLPGAYCFLENKRLKIYDVDILNKNSIGIPGKIMDIDTGLIVNTKDKLIRINDLKLEGKNRCKTNVFLNGYKKENLIGKVLK